MGAGNHIRERRNQPCSALGADLFPVIHRNLSPAPSPPLPGPHISPSHAGRSCHQQDWGPCFPRGWGRSPRRSSSRESSCDRNFFSWALYRATILPSSSTSVTSTPQASRSRLAILGHRESLHQGKPSSIQR